MYRPVLTFAVYEPPEPGLPFLAVMIDADGAVTARAFKSGEEAEAFNHQMAPRMGARLGLDAEDA